MLILELRNVADISCFKVDYEGFQFYNVIDK